MNSYINALPHTAADVGACSFDESLQNVEIRLINVVGGS